MKKRSRLILFVWLFLITIPNGHASELALLRRTGGRDPYRRSGHSPRHPGKPAREYRHGVSFLNHVLSASNQTQEFRFIYPDVDLNIEFSKTLANEGKNFKWKSAYQIVEMINSGDITADVVYLDNFVYSHVAELLNDPYWGEKHLVDVSDLPWFRESQKDFILSSPYRRFFYLFVAKSRDR